MEFKIHKIIPPHFPNEKLTGNYKIKIEQKMSLTKRNLNLYFKENSNEEINEWIDTFLRKEMQEKKEV